MLKMMVMIMTRVVAIVMTMTMMAMAMLVPVRDLMVQLESQGCLLGFHFK